MFDKNICICKNCAKNSDIKFAAQIKPCERCGENLTELNLTVKEFVGLQKYGVNLVCEMSKLKEENPIDFQIKFNELTKPKVVSSQPSGVPKCPTCGSTNIKKISGGKRWLTTGIFGLASSDVGKTMQCNKCGAKW